jgi:hypothetical protein
MLNPGLTALHTLRRRTKYWGAYSTEADCAIPMNKGCGVQTLRPGQGIHFSFAAGNSGYCMSGILAYSKVSELRVIARIVEDCGWTGDWPEPPLHGLWAAMQRRFRAEALRGYLSNCSLRMLDIGTRDVGLT